MTFNFYTFSTNMKATFDMMEKYGESRYEQEKVRNLLEKIRTTNHNLEYAITFCKFNHNEKLPHCKKTPCHTDQIHLSSTATDQKKT